MADLTEWNFEKPSVPIESTKKFQESTFCALTHSIGHVTDDFTRHPTNHWDIQRLSHITSTMIC
jgi:hypothetical protein